MYEYRKPLEENQDLCSEETVENSTAKKDFSSYEQKHEHVEKG